MPDIQTHEEGMLCSADLITADVASAKRFYAELFGWTLQAMPGPGGTDAYVMAQLRGRHVCGIAPQPPDQRERRVPPSWLSYVAVADVDARAAKVTRAGGTVVASPFDIPGAGRMAIVQDPSAATIALWQAKGHPGAGVMNEPGSLCWTELWTSDPKRAEAFWTKVLPWSLKSSPGYGEWMVGDRAAGGMFPMPPEMNGVPSQWTIYFAVDDCDATVKRATSMGATLMKPAADIPGVGRFAVLMDAQGAPFNVLELTGQA
jgi:predicted enzyme related to lactoylglutathione lyase